MSFPSATLALPGAGLYRNIWHHAAGARLRLLMSMSLLLGSQMLKLAMPWLAAQAIDTLQRGGPQAMLHAGGWIAAIVALYVGVWTLHGPGRVLERNVGVRVRRHVSDALYAKLTRVPLAWHEQRHSGDVQHRVHQASRALYDFTQNQFIYLQNAVSFVGPLAALWLLSSVTGGAALLGYGLVAFVILRFDTVLMRLVRTENDAERRYASGLIDFLGNIATVIGLRLQSPTRRLLQRRLDAVFQPLRRSIVLNEAKWCAVDLLSVVLTWSLVGAYVWHTHDATGAVLLGSVFMVYQYAQQAGGVVGAMASNFQNLARIRSDFASADVIIDAPEPSAAARAVDAAWRRIDLLDIGFEHVAGPQAGAAERGGLRHVHLTLNRGERIALVGPSGSGKSTLMRVLAGLYDAQHGHVEVDGVAQLGLRHLGGITTLIPQSCDIFEASVRENIDFGDAVDTVRLNAAVHASAFDVVLAGLPQGLDTPLAERGSNLSGGQRQRLGLARGILASEGSSLLLLDEPTSALDPLTEALIHERLNAHVGDACMVASVHRMSLLRHFDRVVLMAGGCIVDNGSVNALAERQPMFREMLHGREAETLAA